VQVYFDMCESLLICVSYSRRDHLWPLLRRRERQVRCSVCCSVLQCVSVCGSMLQCVVATVEAPGVLQYVLQSVAVCFSVR